MIGRTFVLMQPLRKTRKNPRKGHFALIFRTFACLNDAGTTL
jgi:hypothetical protein